MQAVANVVTEQALPCVLKEADGSMKGTQKSYTSLSGSLALAHY